MSTPSVAWQLRSALSAVDVAWTQPSGHVEHVARFQGDVQHGLAQALDAVAALAAPEINRHVRYRGDLRKST